MLVLEIPYESIWNNSFLSGHNNVPAQEAKARKYIASMSSLSKEENYIERDITMDTVMGVLNRLIGDRRKLFQSRAADNYFFKEEEASGSVSFENVVKSKQDEMVFLRNLNLNTDKASISGQLNTGGARFESKEGKLLWSVCFLEPSQLIQFLLSEDLSLLPKLNTVNILDVRDRFEGFIKKIKPIKVQDLSEDQLMAEEKLSSLYGQSYRDKSGEKLLISSFYCSALYLALDLMRKEDLSVDALLAPRGGLSGVSKRGFTEKDFMGSAAKPKLIFGNPYFSETFEKGVGKTRRMLNKSSGLLIIKVDVSDERALRIRELIASAGVMSFPLGKKGLSYLGSIRVV